MTEFARQSRAIRTLPQRLRAKHSKAQQHMTISSPTAIQVPVVPSVRSLTPVSVRKVGLDRSRSLTQGSLPEQGALDRLSTTEDEQEDPTVAPKLPRSVLQRQHMEWRRAMLQATEAATSETKDETKSGSSIHGELYDTLFTLQTLNSKTGLEEFLSRVRSVYETKNAMGKSITNGSKDSSVKPGAYSKSVSMQCA